MDLHLVTTMAKLRVVLKCVIHCICQKRKLRKKEKMLRLW